VAVPFGTRRYPGTDGESGETTYYVSAETGYPVRFESPDSDIRFHSYGDVDPVEAPDMDCQEIGEGGGYGDG
jgi:hypothetical protein